MWQAGRRPLAVAEGEEAPAFIQTAEQAPQRGGGPAPCLAARRPAEKPGPASRPHRRALPPTPPHTHTPRSAPSLPPAAAVPRAPPSREAPGPLTRRPPRPPRAQPRTVPAVGRGGAEVPLSP